MKIKLFILTLLVSNLVYANGWKLISHKEDHISWNEYLSQMNKVENKGATCKASADPASGKAGDNIKATGEVSYTISNDIDASGVYFIDEYMCIVTFGCTHIQDSGSLDPHSTQYADANMFTVQNIPESGTYTDQATIRVTGASTCSTQNSNTVTVS